MVTTDHDVGKITPDYSQSVTGAGYVTTSVEPAPNMSTTIWRF